MALKSKYSPLQHLSLDNIFASFGEMSPRNKIIALGVAGAIILIVLFLPLSLLSGKVSSFQKKIASSKTGYENVQNKIAEYNRVQVETRALESRFGRQGGSLTSRVESVARKSGISVDQLREKGPQETDYLEINSIEATLSGVTISQLMEFLYDIENDTTSPMRIRKIQIKPSYRKRSLLKVSCEVATFVLKEEV